MTGISTGEYPSPQPEGLLDQLLDQWDEARSEGRPESADSICAKHPHLVGALKARIRRLEQTDWLFDAEQTGELPPPDNSAHVRMPESTMSSCDFVAALCESGLLTPGGLEQAKRMELESDKECRSIAASLVEAGELTVYQASVLLGQSGLPLQVEHFRVQEIVGAGGMGTVYLALDTRSSFQVVIKLLKPESADSPEKIARFHREAKAAQRLEHPNVVKLLDVGDSKFGPFLVMEYVDGPDLSKHVRTHRPLDVGTAVDYLRQAALALQHAHERGVVHRDIKPSNLLATAVGHIKVADFGLATVSLADKESHAATSVALTTVGAVMGTAAFMAPEQALDINDADQRSDFYSLGATLFFMLHGKPMFEEATFMKMIVAHRESDIPSLCESRDDVPRSLDRIFRRMVRKRPEDRFQSAGDLLAALDRCQIAIAGSKSKPIRKLAATLLTVSFAVIAPVIICSRLGLLSPLARTPAPGPSSDQLQHSVGSISVPKVVEPVRPKSLMAPIDSTTIEHRRQEWAAFLNAPKQHENSLGMSMMLIPPGQVNMGLTEGDAEHKVEQIRGTLHGEISKTRKRHVLSEAPRHAVELTEPFYVSCCEVTVGQFREFAETTGYVTQAENPEDKIGPGGFSSVNALPIQIPELNWRRPGYEQTELYPVVLISWHDAVAFCEWLSGREGIDYGLPSEAQWEYMCHAEAFPHESPDELEDLKEYAHFSLEVRNDVLPQATGLLRSNAFGIYDLLGNAREWCQDWYDPQYYQRAPKANPVGPEEAYSGSVRVIRGGGTCDHPLIDLRPTFRYPSNSYRRYDAVGFRVVTVNQFHLASLPNLDDSSSD